MLRNLGIRSKLLALVAIPMTLLLAMSLVVSLQARSQAVKAGHVSDLTRASVLLNGAVHALQNERTATVRYLVSGRDKSAHAAMLAARRPVDVQLQTLRGVVDQLDVNGLGETLSKGIAAAGKNHDGVATLRSSVDKGGAHADAVLASYNGIVKGDLTLSSVVANYANDEVLSNELRAYGSLSETIEASYLERDLLADAFRRKSMDIATYASFTSLLAVQENALSTFTQLATPQNRARLNSAIAQGDGVTLEAQRARAGGLLVHRGNGDAKAIIAAADSRIKPLTNLEGSLVDQIKTDADADAAAGRNRALAVAGLALGAVLVALFFVLVISRRMVGPLTRLTAKAGELGTELPLMVERMQTPGEGPGVEVSPVLVESQDEIGKLAAAFNSVNEITVKVAREQAALRASIAEMFVNVARRNQVLLGRQLSFIDELEQTEEDPDILENLFRLDHLATRMRRNSESLLVLAGIDANRRLRRAMPLTDVIRTAASEIEQYERVDLSPAFDAPVSGRHALTIAHLLAELLENATHFSNPETRVIVSTSFDDLGAHVTVTDYGLGMSHEEIEDANSKISNPPMAEIAIAQRLGFYVVGRLARRLGATVTVGKGRSAGVVVDVVLPAETFERGSVPEVPATSGEAPVASPVERPAAVRPTTTAPAPAPVVRAEVAVPGAPEVATRAPSTTATPVPRRLRKAMAPAPAETRQEPVVPTPVDLSAAASAVEAALEPISYAPSVDILPGRPLGRRSRKAHGNSGSSARSAAPAPVATAGKGEGHGHGDAAGVGAGVGAGQASRTSAIAAMQALQGRRASVPAQAPAPDVEQLTRRPSPAPAPDADEDVEQIAAGAQMASDALAELSRLSAGYEPTFQPEVAVEEGGLTRRQRRASQPAAEATRPAVPARERNANEVRGMLSGFRAGVERGRNGSDTPSQSS